MTAFTSAPAADWLRLWRLIQQSLGGARRLLRHFGAPAAALAAAPAEWQALGVPEASVERLAAWQYGDDAVLLRELDEGLATDLAWCEGTGQGVLAIDHPEYPALLRQIADPPPLLFFRGDPRLLDLPQVAVVGTRHPSLTGRADAEHFGGELARAGLVVTSGLARGVDTGAHLGALRAGGRTVAVLGTGPDRPYPRENTRLYLNIAEGGGVLVSEFLPGEPPLGMHFPRRNRIISGLSLGVLVVEAAPESGSLITARKAAEQGRLVWALPGSRHNAQAQGCISLIRDGVTAVANVGQMLADLPPMVGALKACLGVTTAPDLPPVVAGARDLPAALAAAGAIATLEPGLRQVLEALGEEARHPDSVIGAIGQPPSLVLQALSRLEIAGFIAAVPGGYARLPPAPAGEE